MASSLKELLDALSEHYGLEPFIPDDDGIYSLVSNGISVNLGSFSNQDKIFLYAPIANFDDKDAEETALALLSLNYDFLATNGATFSQNPETGYYALERIETLSTLTEETFNQIFGDFIHLAREWSERISRNEVNENTSQTGAEETLTEGSASPPKEEPRALETIPSSWISV